MTSQLQQMAPPRDQDELEGTLLLGIPVDNTGSNTLGAVPMAHFEYEDAIAEAVQQHQQQDYGDDLPTAPLIPRIDNEQQREQWKKHQTKLAKQRGLQQAELEKEGIAKAAIESYAINYWADRKIEEANRIAKLRNAQGVQIDKDPWAERAAMMKGQSSDETNMSVAPPAFPSSREGGGYEFAEYQMNEYTTSDDYDVTEYKSVYDP